MIEIEAAKTGLQEEIVKSEIDKEELKKVNQAVDKALKANKNDVSAALGQILRIGDVKEADKMSQRLLVIDDDTDLEAAAVVDY